MKKVAVIMAGGTSNQLWPRGNKDIPEQFLHFIGDGTMLQNTFMRLLPVFDVNDIYIVAAESMKELIYEQLPQTPKENIILEPFGKHTAPCLALTDLVLKDKYEEDTIMLAFPADHYIYNIREFQYSIELAAEFAHERNCIVTIGVRPSRPVSDYGYVQMRDSKAGIEDYYDKGVRYTAAFAEKPDIETAKRFIESSDFLWNTGIYIWSLKTFRDLFANFLPDNDALFQSLRDRKYSELTADEIAFIYRQVQAVSLDYSILEKASNVFVVEGAFRWSDLNSWDEFYRLAIKDGRNNLIEGKVVALDTSNSYISSSEKLIATVGIKDLFIIESKDAILVCRRGDSESVKKIVAHLKRQQINQLGNQ